MENRILLTALAFVVSSLFYNEVSANYAVERGGRIVHRRGAESAEFARRVEYYSAPSPRPLRLCGEPFASHAQAKISLIAWPTICAEFTESDYARHVSALKRRLPSPEFTVVVEPPFVVIGDGGKKAVESYASGTVKWAVELLKRDYFAKDPKEILDIWLFKDAVSYRKHAKLLFKEEPTTPYGYYSAAHKSLVMNIETGGGTLVHEIVHPFIEANFPNCPAWLNEGLGSLYEQCGEQDGHIRGYTNWRLPGLQRAIERGGLTPFKTLLAMDARTFYNEDKGTNYSQSRYLLYYLQERGLLTRFYREFLANSKDDPTGFDTLQKILGETDMDDFQKRWEKFVLGLS